MDDPSRESFFVPNLQFVDSGTEGVGKMKRVHVMREVVRKQKWKHAQMKSAVYKRTFRSTGPLPWTIRGTSFPSAGESSLGDRAESSTPEKVDIKLEDSDELNSTISATPRINTRRSPSQETPSTTPKPTIHRPGNGLIVPSKTDPQTMLSAGRSDPFGSYSIQKPGHRSEELADIVLFEMGSSRYGDAPQTAKYFPPRDLYLSRAIHDPVELQAVFALAACGHDRLRGRSPGPRALAHKLDALELVNDRLRSYDTATSDSTIFAVSTLWLIESFYDNPRASQPHVEGLQKMIAYRGGVASLDPRIQIILAWYAVYLPQPFTVPLFPTSTISPAYNRPDVYLRACTKELVTFIRAAHLLSISEPSPYAVHRDFFESCKLMTRFIMGSTKVTESREYPQLQSVCRMAILLWIHTIFIEHSQSQRIVARELQRLHLRMLDHQLDSRGTIELVFSLLMKNEETLTMHDRAWPVARMMNVAKMISLETLEDTAELLLDFLMDKLSPGVSFLHYSRVAGLLQSEFKAPGEILSLELKFEDGHDEGDGT